jgi:3-oxosteroid 1-dehydrogenase
MSDDWDEEYDIVVVGAGSAGLTAALTATTQSMSVCVIEKTEVFGGTSALSGGVIWIPNNHLMAQQGIADSPEKALTYLKHNIGNRVSESRLARFVDQAPNMLKLLTDRGFLEVDIFKGFPDYVAETPGGMAGGRSVEPRVIAGRKLGDWFDNLRRRNFSPPVVGTMTELRQLAVIRADFFEFLKAWRAIPRNFIGKLTNAKHQATGAGLITWLVSAAKKIGVPVHLNSRLVGLVSEGDTVLGVEVQTCDGIKRLRATQGVILAAGGFEHNQALREKHFGQYGGRDHSSGAPGNQGDVIECAKQIGAAFDLMDDCWWAPTCFIPGKGPQIVIFERGKPGQIIVSREGERFANEAQSYNELVRAMFDAHRSGLSTLPSYMIFDQTYRDKYPLADMMPGITPKDHLESGFLKRADTIASLATLAGIDPDGLQATIDRFNIMAKHGVDEDFHRGEFAFDQFSGDNLVEPNNCLAPIVKPPFYCMEITAGDLGTKGGLLTNENAQVLREDSSVIEGLYAAGNCSASVMGNFYPGAGGTIGPAMTFGYIAALHATPKP